MALKSNFKKYLLDRKRIEATKHSITVLKFSVQLRQSIEQLRALAREVGVCAMCISKAVKEAKPYDPPTGDISVVETQAF